jgi:phage antirepressor YoqD-like protein
MQGLGSMKTNFKAWLRDLYYQYRDEGGELSHQQYWDQNRLWLKRTFKEQHTVRVEEDDGEPS